MAKTLARAGIDTQAMAASADVLGVFQGQNVLYLRLKSFAPPRRASRSRAASSADAYFESDDEFPDAEPNELRVALVRGAGLASRRGFLKGGAPDPRCTIRVLPGKRAKLTSKVCKKTSEPVWRETFALPLDESAATLRVTVEDWDKLAKPDFLGRAEVDLTELARVRAGIAY